MLYATFQIVILNINTFLSYFFVGVLRIQHNGEIRISGAIQKCSGARHEKKRTARRIT
jgi:hypothetical protein